MNTHPRQQFPLRPDAGELVRRDAQSISRMLAGCVLSKIHGGSPESVVRRAWPDDSRAQLFTRAAVNPTDTTATAITATKTSPLLLIAPSSAAARLFEKCLRLDLGGVLSYSVPHAATHPLPLFVAEGAPFPFVQPSTAKATLGPARKLGFGIAITRELEEASPDSAAAILARLLGESAAKALDQYVFDAVAADATRPAGLLNGVTPLTASTSTSVLDAIAADIGTFASAISAAGINPENMILVCNPKEGFVLRMTGGYEAPAINVFMTPSVASGTVIAVVPEAIASGYDGLPEVETSKQASVHFEDTSPQPIVGTGGVVASPVRSLFQPEMIGVKVRLRCAWASLQPGAVQFMTSVKW
jgi:hypothetical protein